MFNRLFYGRNGFDMFSGFIIIFAMLFFQFGILVSIIGVLLILYAIFRTFSRNIEKRKHELWVFQNIIRKIAIFFQRIGAGLNRAFKPLGRSISEQRTKWRQRKEYKFVKCKKCNKTLRLPRNKGKLVATCPVCRYEFKVKT